MPVKYADDALTTLAANLSTTATSMAVASSATFPALGTSDYFYATLQRSSDNAKETVRVETVSGTTWIMVRAQGSGETALAFVAGDAVELRVCANLLDDLTLATDELAGVLVETQTVTSAGQLAFTLTNFTYNIAIDGALSVFYEGVYLTKNVQWTPTSSSVVTLAESVPTEVGERLVFVKNATVSTNTPLAANTTYTPPGTGAVDTDTQTALRGLLVPLDQFPTVQTGLDSGATGATQAFTLNKDSMSTDKVELNETYQTYIEGYGSAESILSFTNTDGTQCVSIPAMGSDRYHSILRNFKVQGGALTGDGVHANTPTIAPWIQGLWIRDCSGSGKAGLKMTDAFIGRIDDVKSFSNDIGIDLINTKGIAGSGSWVSDNVSWGVKLDEDCVGNDIQLTELGLSSLDITKQALYINGKSNRIGCLFYENFTAPRAIDLDSKSLGNVLDFVHSSPFMVWDDGSFNIYPMDNDAPLVNLNSGFYFGGHSVSCGDLQNQFVDSSWQDGVTSLRFNAFGATAPARSHETTLGYLDDNSLKLDWGTTALSGVESNQTFSVNDGDNVAIMMMVRADRDFGTDENLIFKVLGAGNENRATLYVSDFRQNIWRPVFLTYRATVTESVTIGISLVAATTHTALITYVDDVVFAVNKRTIGLLRNDTASTVTHSENQGALIPKGVFNTCEVQVATNKARVGGRLHTDMTQTGTTAVTTEETLATYSLVARSLWENNQGLRITAFGTTASNANTKRVRIYLGGTGGDELADTGAVAANNKDWRIQVDLFRTGETAQKSISSGVFNDAIETPQYAAGTQDLKTALDIVVTGQNGTASANDLVLEGFIIEAL